MPATIYGYLGSLRQEGSVGSLYPVRTSQCTIGRDSDCSVRIHQVYISHKHCLIKSHTNRESTIQSLSLDSCTLLNDANLEESVATLRHGDIITLGERRFLWQYPESSKFWSNPEKKYLKISPTTSSSKAIGEKVPKVRTNPAKVLSKSLSARRPSQTVTSRLTPGFLLKKAVSQHKLSSLASGFEADWPPMTPTQKKNAAKKKLRATSANYVTETSAKKMPEHKSSNFKTQAPNMLASLQKNASEMGLADGGTSKYPHTVYGQLAVLRPNGASGSRLPLSAENCTIGRSLDCSIRIALSTVADKQCLISSGKNEVSTITNLSQVSSTILNGERLGDAPKNLCHGDLITMAERSFRWEYPTSSKFWVPDETSNVESIRTNQYEKPSPGSISSKSQKKFVATDDRKVASSSKSGPLKMSSVKVSVPKVLPPKKTSKASSTTKAPTPAVTSNSFFRHLNPAQPLHMSMKHASSLRTPPTERKANRKKSPPSPLLKLVPELSKNKVPSMKTLPRKVSSFNAPTPNTKTFLAGKFSDKKKARPGAAKPPTAARKSLSSLPRMTQQRVSSSDSSFDRSLSPPPPAEGPELRGSRNVAKIDPSLFKGCCFTSNAQNVLKEKAVTGRPASPD